MTLKFGSCPKCQGDLQVKRDIYGMFINCLQCGLQKDLDAPNAAIEVSEPARVLAKTPAREKLLRAA